MGYQWRMSPIPELLLRQIDRWCARTVPEHARKQVRLESRCRGRSVTVVEHRAPSGDEAEPDWTERRIAQLRYGTDGQWSLYSPDRGGRWRQVPGVPTASAPVPLLEEIDNNTGGAFPP